MNKLYSGRRLKPILDAILRKIDRKSDTPNWTQNDPRARDYIKNRPGGYETEREIVLCDGTFATVVKEDLNGDGTSNDIVGFGKTLALTIGSRFRVIIDGVDYGDLTCRNDGYEVPIIGNLWLSGAEAQDTGEPFFIFPDGAKIAGDADSHAVMIATTEKTVVKIPEKFLPPPQEIDYASDGVFRQSLIDYFADMPNRTLGNGDSSTNVLETLGYSMGHYWPLSEGFQASGSIYIRIENKTTNETFEAKGAFMCFTDHTGTVSINVSGLIDTSVTPPLEVKRIAISPASALMHNDGEVLLMYSGGVAGTKYNLKIGIDGAVYTTSISPAVLYPEYPIPTALDIGKCLGVVNTGYGAAVGLVDAPKEFGGSWNDLADRPGGYTQPAILLEATLDFGPLRSTSSGVVQPSQKYGDQIDLNLGFALEAGKTYTVTLDGVEYAVTAANHDSYGVYVGNPGVLANDIAASMRPEVFFFSSEGYACGPAGAHDIRISADEVVKIPAELLDVPNIPAHSAADAGKVLGVDADGNLAWVTPGI